jgi:hypothetical protein
MNEVDLSLFDELSKAKHPSAEGRSEAMNRETGGLDLLDECVLVGKEICELVLESASVQIVGRGREQEFGTASSQSLYQNKYLVHEPTTSA